MKVAILCGGFATRLQPLTDHLPKSLIDIHGKPFIAWQLELLKQQDITDIVLCVGHLDYMIRDVVGDGHRYGVNVVYSFDGAHPLGTAGSLQKALPLLGKKFFVLYGDSYLDGVDYRDVDRAFDHSGRLALMTVCNPPNGERGNVVLSGKHIWLYDKTDYNPTMLYIDYGLSVVSNEALEHTGYSDLSDMFYRLSCCSQLEGYEVPVPYHTIGTFDELEETREHLKCKV